MSKHVQYAFKSCRKPDFGIRQVTVFPRTKVISKGRKGDRWIWNSDHVIILMSFSGLWAAETLKY